MATGASIPLCTILGASVRSRDNSAAGLQVCSWGGGGGGGGCNQLQVLAQGPPQNGQAREFRLQHYWQVESGGSQIGPQPGQAMPTAARQAGPADTAARCVPRCEVGIWRLLKNEENQDSLHLPL